MLDEYKEKQNVVYQILKKAVNNNKYSHAYLFEVNGNNDAFNIALSFAKLLLCPNKYSNNKECVNCTQCHRIDNDDFLELKIIAPDGLWIKKDQLKELQHAFKVKGIETSKRVYIITDANKLNESSSNTLLKFLEEPPDNVIAILLSDNIYSLLDTIVSRCQIISLRKNDDDKIEQSLSLNNEDTDELITSTIKFINYLEKNGLKTILNSKKIFLNVFDNKDKLITFFEISLLLYKDTINYKIENKLKYFNKNDIIEVEKNNNLNQLIEKMQKFIHLKDYIYVNANTNLLIDKLIIDIEGVK